MSEIPAREAGAKIAESAKKMERSNERMEDTADRRTELAADRTVLAAERTYAAWVRTGLVALASGIGSKALLTGTIPAWLVLATGTVLVAFAGFCFAAGVWRDLRPAMRPVPEVQRLPPALLIAVNGFLVFVALAVLVGIWFGNTPPVAVLPPG
jgi:putative membrane protein